MIALVGQAIRAGTIGLAYIIRGGKDHRVYAEDLVTSGIYAHVRNPMYLGNAFLLAGLAIASNSWLFVLVGVPIALAVHATIIAAEEDFLRKKFGAQYDTYCARVPRLLPKLRGLAATFRGMRFDWRKVVRQEYAKPFDWIVAIAVVIIFNLWRADLIGGAPRPRRPASARRRGALGALAPRAPAQARRVGRRRIIPAPAVTRLCLAILLTCATVERSRDYALEECQER